MTVNLTENGGLLIREGVGIKIQSLQPTESSLDYAALHDRFISATDSPYHGREGSGYILRIKNTDESISGRSFYVIFADKAEKLSSWISDRKENVVIILKDQKILYTVDFTNGIKIFEGGKELLS